jgi:hypothetical protein
MQNTATLFLFSNFLFPIYFCKKKDVTSKINVMKNRPIQGWKYTDDKQNTLQIVKINKSRCAKGLRSKVDHDFRL